MVVLYIILMHISCFIYFANDLLLTVYFIFILDYRNDVRHKANSSDFFIQVQNGSTCNYKQRQLVTSTVHLPQELLMTLQCSGESRSFARETRALKMRV